MSFRSDISAFALHRIRDFVHRTAGIVIGPDKTALVTGRLWRRLAICGLPSYDAYVDFIARPEGAQERSTMLDLLTTNETYFFREEKHFAYLQKLLQQIVHFWLGILQILNQRCNFHCFLVMDFLIRWFHRH